VRADLRHKAARLGIVSGLVPALKVGGTFVPNPTVITDRMLDEYGRVIHGDFKTGRRTRKASPRSRGARSTFPSSTRRSRNCAEAARDVPRVHDEEPRGAAEAEAFRVEREQGELPRAGSPST